MKEFMSVPLRQKAYQPFGDVRLSFPRKRGRHGLSPRPSTSTPPSPS